MMAGNGAHFKKKGSGKSAWLFRSSRSARIALVLACFVVCLGVGGSIAWLVASSSLVNRFELGEVSPVVNEDTGTTTVDEAELLSKSNVSVTNMGTSAIPIYVRVSLAGYWRYEDGSVAWVPVIVEEPGPDAVAPTYTIDWGNVQGEADAEDPSSGCWIAGDDGYYYWSIPLDASATTDVLIDELVDQNYPGQDNKGRTLVVDITAEGIQADPARAAEEAWGVSIDPDTGVLTPAASGSQGGE